MTNIVNSTLPTPNNHSEKNKPDGVFVIKQGKTNYKVKWKKHLSITKIKLK